MKNKIIFLSFFFINLVSCEEYILLEQLNVAASARYEVVGQQSQTIIQQLTNLSQKQAMLESYFGQIDELYASAKQLNKVC